MRGRGAGLAAALFRGVDNDIGKGSRGRLFNTGALGRSLCNKLLEACKPTFLEAGVGVSGSKKDSFPTGGEYT